MFRYNVTIFVESYVFFSFPLSYTRFHVRQPNNVFYVGLDFSFNDHSFAHRSPADTNRVLDQFVQNTIAFRVRERYVVLIVKFPDPQMNLVLVAVVVGRSDEHDPRVNVQKVDKIEQVVVGQSRLVRTNQRDAGVRVEIVRRPGQRSKTRIDRWFEFVTRQQRRIALQVSHTDQQLVQHVESLYSITAYDLRRIADQERERVSRTDPSFVGRSNRGRSSRGREQFPCVYPNARVLQRCLERSRRQIHIGKVQDARDYERKVYDAGRTL